MQSSLYTGQLPSGNPVILHLWLTAQTENNTIRLRGFGTFESLDPMIFSMGSGQTMMPLEAMNELLVPGLLFVEMPSEQRQIPCEVRIGYAQTIPFHLECQLNGSQVRAFIPIT